MKIFDAGREVMVGFFNQNVLTVAFSKAFDGEKFRFPEGQCPWYPVAWGSPFAQKIAVGYSLPYKGISSSLGCFAFCFVEVGRCT